MTFQRVAVVGAGLIGGSVALHLLRHGVDVVVCDPDPDTQRAAAAAGLPVAGVAPPDRDLVLVAAPLDALPGVLTSCGRHCPDAVVADLGSVKGPPATAAAAAGIAERYVGLHPMAGTEHSGFAHADADLLVDVTWAATRGTGPVADVAGWVAEVFAATVVVLDADEHDRSVALVSHAPHVLAQALLELVETAADLPAARHLAAGSFASGTRVAGTNPARTFNMLAENADALGLVLDRLLDSIGGYRADLGDPEALRARLEAVGARAAEVRRPETLWTPCPSPSVAVDAPGATLVRWRGRWETTPA